MANEEQIKRAKELYRQGKKLVEIAAELGRPEGTIRRWKSTYGWDGERSKKGSERSGKKSERSVLRELKKEKELSEEIRLAAENDELTDRQRLFCVLYTKCFNATKAYQKAYGCDYNTAMVNGSRMLRFAKVKETILSLKQNRMDRELFSEDDIFQKYMDIAFADITDFVGIQDGTAIVFSMGEGETKISQMMKHVACDRVIIYDTPHPTAKYIEEKIMSKMKINHYVVGPVQTNCYVVINEENKEMFEFMKEALDGKVKEVRLSQRLKSHPFCLTSDGELSLEMEKVLNSMPTNEQKVKAEIALEINANHALANKLKELYENDKDTLKNYAKLLYAQGCLISGVSVIIVPLIDL